LVKPPGREYRVHFFFPFYHVGGAEKVHALIAEATGGEDCIIYFTRKSVNASFLDEFRKSRCTIKELPAFTSNKWLYPLNLIYRGMISGWINSQEKKPIVFNGQSNFGYKLSPWIARRISQVELIHALNTFAYIRLPYLSFYARSVTVSTKVIEQYRIQYAGNKVPETLFHSFISIMSRIRLPQRTNRNDYYSEELTVLYCGRDTPDKRPQIAAAIAARLAPQYRIRFLFAGAVKHVIPEMWQKHCEFIGEITDEKEMYRIYERAHILIIPSLSESGPLVFMEAMSKGAAIVSTPVGYIPSNIRHGQEGFVTSTTDEETTINEMSAYILELYNDRGLLQRIGQHNVDYAFSHFGIDTFNEEYRQLFSSLNDTRFETT
jgi:L-malate glycosyltransferase